MIDFQVSKTKLGSFTFKDGQKKLKTRVDVYDQCLEIFEKGKNPIKTYFWTDITYLSIVNENYMHFIFSEESFIFPKNKEFDIIFPLIIEVLQRTSLRPILNKLGLSVFSTKKDLPSDISVFTRFYSLISGYQFEKEIINMYSSDLFFKKEVIDLRQYENNIDFVICVLSTLPICSFVNSIIVPSSCFSVFVDYLREPTPKKLKFLSLEGNFSDTLLKNVVQYLPHLRGISITKCNCNVNKILDMIESTKIKSVEFHSIEDMNFNEPISILSLNFDGTNNLDLKSYAHCFTGLAYLSLANCGLEVSEVFQTIKDNNLIIRKLNISGNKFDKPCVFDDLVFLTIIADNVSFGKNCLISIVSFQTQILSLKNAQIADESEWDSAIEIVGKSAVHSLYWDNNYLNEQFFLYANKFYVLSLSKCRRLTQGLSQTFISFLEKANNLSELIVRGSEDDEKCCLGQLTGKIIDSVSHISLKRLDIKFSNGGDSALDRLNELIKSGKCPRKIEIDGINATNNNKARLFPSIFETAKEKRVKISFPVNEIGNDKKLIEIIKKANFKGKEDGFFVKPCCVYLEAEKPLIPLYIKDSVLKTLYLHRSAQIVINPIFLKGQIVVERNADFDKYFMQKNSGDDKDFIDKNSEIRSIQSNKTLDETDSDELSIPIPFEKRSKCSHSNSSIVANDMMERDVKVENEEEETLSLNFFDSEKELPKPKVVNRAKEMAEKRRSATKTEFKSSPPRNVVKAMMKKVDGRNHDWTFPDFEKHDVDTNQIWKEMENKFELTDLCNQLRKEKKKKSKTNGLCHMKKNEAKNNFTQNQTNL